MNRKSSSISKPLWPSSCGCMKGELFIVSTGARSRLTRVQAPHGHGSGLRRLKVSALASQACDYVCFSVALGWELRYASLGCTCTSTTSECTHLLWSKLVAGEQSPPERRSSILLVHIPSDDTCTRVDGIARQGPFCD